jgi:hypothetical protein
VRQLGDVHSNAPRLIEPTAAGSGVISDGHHTLIASSAPTISVCGIVRPSRFGSFEIDNQLQFGRLLDGKISRLGTFKYFVHVGRSTTEEIGEVLSV